MTERYMNTLGEARAHGLAVRELGGSMARPPRQVLVMVEFDYHEAKRFAFWKCLGACPKCDRLWLELHQGLRRLEVVHIDAPETTTPSEPEVLAD